MRNRQRGVALLTAILLVALATILATGIAYQNAMSARRGTATFAFDQSFEIAEAAEALAGAALKQDYNEDPAHDTPAESWAKPFGPVEVVPGVALEAQLDDASGRFNINSLIKPGGPGIGAGAGTTETLDRDALAAFKALLRSLDMEEKWAYMVADWIDRDNNPSEQFGAEDSLYSSQTPAYRPPNRAITSTTELLALPKFGRDNYLKLAPYIVALPPDAKLNICTASDFVLDAMTATDANPEGTKEFVGPEGVLEKGRQTKCFPDKQTYLSTITDPTGKQSLEQRIDEKSSYFRLTSIVTVGNTQFALYSLLSRQGAQVRPIMRSFSPD